MNTIVIETYDLGIKRAFHNGSETISLTVLEAAIDPEQHHTMVDEKAHIEMNCEAQANAELTGQFLESYNHPNTTDNNFPEKVIVILNEDGVILGARTDAGEINVMLVEQDISNNVHIVVDEEDYVMQTKIGRVSK